MRGKHVFGLITAMLLGLIVWSQRERATPPPDARVGRLPDGGFLLPSGWTLRPAGTQVPLSTLPLAARLLPDGKTVLVLQSGYRTPSLSVHDARSGALKSAIELKDSFHGLAMKGDRICVGGGATGAIFEVFMEGGQLTSGRTMEAAPDPLPQDGSFIGDLSFSPDGRMLYAADISGNQVVVLDVGSGKVLRRIATARMPYRILFHPDGKQFGASSWSGAEVVRHNAADGSILQRLALGSHPTNMVWQPAPKKASERRREQGLRLFVAAAHTNDVYVIASSASGDLSVLERINVALTPKQPLGMTPSALALDTGGERLYIACSDANAIAVADVSGAMSRVNGFIPTGWYPTATLPLEDGRLIILNGKGVRSFPNPKGPQDTMDRRKMSQQEREALEHVGRIHVGGMSLVDPVDEMQLAEHTRVVYMNSPYRDYLLEDAGAPNGNPIPSKPGEPSPIRHVIYIVKENRTYDQVFGDLGVGNGDPSLVLFTDESSINHRKLAREFVLFDNFYVNGDVSADGHNWSSGAIAPDFTAKLWPNMYGGRGARMSLYYGRPPHNHTEDASRPHGGYLWTRAFEAGMSVRNYGWLTKHRPGAKTGQNQILDAESKQLLENTNPYFRGFDVNYPDVDRMRFFLDDLKTFEQKGEMPRLIVMRLGNDHTAGMRAGAFTPRAMFADNDLSLARLVEAVSKSRFWKETAIFAVEDDAQAGPDHVDSHRSIALVVSPYAKRRHLDSNMYNTVSVCQLGGLRRERGRSGARRRGVRASGGGGSEVLLSKDRHTLEARVVSTAADRARM